MPNIAAVVTRPVDLSSLFFFHFLHFIHWITQLYQTPYSSVVGLGFWVGWLGFSHVNSTIYLQQFYSSLFFHKYWTRGKPRSPNTLGWWHFQWIFCVHIFLTKSWLPAPPSPGILFQMANWLGKQKKEKKADKWSIYWRALQFLPAHPDIQAGTRRNM